MTCSMASTNRTTGCSEKCPLQTFFLSHPPDDYKLTQNLFSAPVQCGRACCAPSQSAHLIRKCSVSSRTHSGSTKTQRLQPLQRHTCAFFFFKSQAAVLYNCRRSHSDFHLVNRSALRRYSVPLLCVPDWEKAGHEPNKYGLITLGKGEKDC